MRNKIPCSAERLSLLDPPMLQSVVDQNAFHIGNQYLSENRVRIIEADDSQISSAVIGNSGLYEQTIRLKDGHLVSRCTCSLPEEPMCRHCIAVLLEYHRWVQPRSGAKRPKPSTSAAPNVNGSADSGSSPAAGPDLKLSEVMGFIEWLQSAMKAIGRGETPPDGSRLSAEVASWAEAIRSLDERRRESEEIQMTFAAQQREREAYVGRMAQQLQASMDEAKAAQNASRQLQQELATYRDILGKVAEIASEIGSYDSQMKLIAGELLSKGGQLDKLSASFREVTAALKTVGKPPFVQ